MLLMNKKCKEEFLKLFNLPIDTQPDTTTFVPLSLEQICKLVTDLLTAFYLCRKLTDLTMSTYIPTKGNKKRIDNSECDKKSKGPFLIQLVENVLNKPVTGYIPEIEDPLPPQPPEITSPTIVDSILFTDNIPTDIG